MASTSSDAVDWAWLPQHILDMIIDKLVLFSDFLQFGAVCKQWHSVAVDYCKKHIGLKKVSSHNNNNHLPLFLVPTPKNPATRSFYNLRNNNLSKFQLQVPNKRTCGSSHGWLIFVDDLLTITLFNPFSGKSVGLPPLPNITILFCDYRIYKVILTADPAHSPKDYELVVLHGGMYDLALYRASNESWLTVVNPSHPLLDDIIYHKGNVYAIDHVNGLEKIQTVVTNSDPIKGYIQLHNIIPRRIYIPYCHMYLVETTCGDLLSVRRLFKGEDHFGQSKTIRFIVYKQVIDEENLKWVEIESLGEDALFLSDNFSMSVSTHEFPVCQPNCIYFSYDGFDNGFYSPFGPRDCGTFNLQTCKFESHYVPDILYAFSPMPSTLRDVLSDTEDDEDEIPHHALPPVWIVPTFH